MAETNISVRFSVQDAETVRAALEKLGTDGQKALSKLNAAGQAPSEGLKAVSAVVDELKTKATGLAFSIGPVGTGLVALGPVGLAAAAALGLVAAAIGHMIEEANRLGSVAQGLRNLGETTGFVGTQIQALINVGGQLGIEGDKVTAGLSRFTAQLDQVRQATGPLYTQIVKVNPALADQLVRTRDNATAWNLLAEAYSRADTAQRAAIARAAFGQSGIGTGRLLEATASAGGIGTLAQRDPGVLTDQQIQKFAELKTRIDETNKTAKDLMASIWTQDVLQRELRAAELFERAAKALKEMHDSGDMPWYVALQLKAAQFLDSIGSPAGKQIISELGQGASGSRSKVTVNAAPSVFAGEGGSGAYTPPVPDKLTAEATLNILRQQMSILGPAASSTEQLRLRQAELNAAVEQAGNRYGGLAARAMDYYRVAQSGADLQIKIQNNVASADELVAQRKRELNLLVAQGKLTQDQANQSLQTYAAKIAPEIVKQEEARRAALTSLKQLEQTSGDLRGQLDSLGTDISRNVGDAFVDMVTGAKSAGDAFKNLEQQVIKSIANMIIQMMIVRPIAMGLQSVLGGFLPGGGTFAGPVGQTAVVGPMPSAKGNIFGFANGGVFTNRMFSSPTVFQFASGGTFRTGVMGERGPEAVVPLVRGPGGDLGVRSQGSGAASPVVVNVYNQSSANTRAQTRQNASGVIDVFIRDAVQGVIAADAQSNGPISKTMMAKVQGYGGR